MKKNKQFVATIEDVMQLHKDGFLTVQDIEDVKRTHEALLEAAKGIQSRLQRVFELETQFKPDVRIHLADALSLVAQVLKENGVSEANIAQAEGGK